MIHGSTIIDLNKLGLVPSFIGLLLCMISASLVAKFSTLDDKLKFPVLIPHMDNINRTWVQPQIETVIIFVFVKNHYIMMADKMNFCLNEMIKKMKKSLDNHIP
jgi:hypothetical protein